MKFKPIEDLEIATPYMLRNDGELFKCGSMHPYIKYSYENNSKDELIKLLNDSSRQDFLLWFYENTNNKEVREYIETIINSVIRQGLVKISKSYLSNFNIGSNTNYTLNETELLECYNLLNEMCNQEFCKIRTSSLKFGGSSHDVYIRIGSTMFNWFDIIWNFVYNNRHFISSVTISTDPQSNGKSIEYYSHNGKKMYLMPTEEFITLSGNPIIEEYEVADINKKAIDKLKIGSNLVEAYDDIHPRYILGFFKEIKESYRYEI